jgi:hypothetical protein
VSAYNMEGEEAGAMPVYPSYILLFLSCVRVLWMDNRGRTCVCPSRPQTGLKPSRYSLHCTPHHRHTNIHQKKEKTYTWYSYVCIYSAKDEMGEPTCAQW